MESYTSFAAVYDEFMDRTPYDQWYRNVQKIFKKYGVPEQGSILELGCGTGKMTRRLAAGGYDVTAVDASQEMLEIAKNSGDDGILYVLQDMAELELPGRVDAAVSICDCMNYLLEEEQLLRVSLELSYEALWNGSRFRILEWRTESTHQWESDESLPLLDEDALSDMLIEE